MSFFADAGAWFDQAGKDTGEWIDQAIQDTGDALTGNSKTPDNDPVSELPETEVSYDPITNSNPAPEKIYYDFSYPGMQRPITPHDGPVVTASGLKITDQAGTGVEASYGQNLEVHYRGMLENGKEFDSSYWRGTPVKFTLGHGVIEGLSEGIQGMKVGGKRTLEIPSHLAYGRRGAGGIIPPNANLIFEVELIAVDGNRDTASPTYETHDAQSLSNNPDPITLDPVLPDQVTEADDPQISLGPVLPDPVTEFDDPQISSGPVLPDLVFEYHDPLTGSEPIQFEGVLEPFDSLTNPNQVFAGTVSEFIERDPFALSGGAGTVIERDPFALSGGEEMVIEPIDGLQGSSTDGLSEFSEEQLQADLVNSMAAPSEVLA